MSKSKTLLILMMTASAAMLHAEPEKKSATYYAKFDAARPPSQGYGFLPSMGLGARFQKEHQGLDLSANLTTIGLLNYASVKGMWLFYPYPEKNNQLYLGAGPGVGYHLNVLPLGSPYGAVSDECGLVNVEGVVGYEFRHSRHLKTFVQVEPSFPVFRFHQDGKYGNKPGVALTAGVGF